MLPELEISRPQFGDFVCPGPGVVEEQDQGVVALGEAAGPGQVLQQFLHFVAFQKVRLGRRHPFHGDGRNPLAGAEHRRLPAGHVLEQGVQGCQTLVARAHTVVAVIFKVAQESQDVFKGQVIKTEFGDLGSLLRGHEHSRRRIVSL